MGAVHGARVKWLCAFVGVIGCGFLSADEPGEAALRFLEQVREKRVNLEPDVDTALTANTAAEKRKEILRRLESLARDLTGGTLEAGEARVDGNLAAVLVRKAGGFDPGRLKVFAVALVNRGGKWLPAPVLASFENSGVGYSSEVRRKLREMEDWMLRQRVADLELLRVDASARMRREIEARLTADELHEATAGQVGRRFLEASAKRDLPVMLGLLGGLRGVLPEDWSLRLAAADAAVGEGDSLKGPWRLLVAPEVFRTVVHEEFTDRSGLISVACLDPVSPRFDASEAELRIVDLELSRDGEQMWQVDPPESFLSVAQDSFDDDRDPFGDDDLQERFPVSMREDLAAQPKAGFGEALAALEAAFQAPDLRPALALLDVSGNHRTARLGCTRLATVWGGLKSGGEGRIAVLMGSHEVGDAGVASYQMFSVSEPDRTDLQHFFFRRSDDGWLLMPGLRPTSDKAQGDLAAVQSWVNARNREWAADWKEKLLGESVRIDAAALGEPPTEDEARELVSGWLDAMRAADLRGMMRRLAWHGGPVSASRVLRNLNFELATARKTAGLPVIDSVHTSGPWAAVGVRFGEADEATHSFYPVVRTSAGPRLLVEIDLVASEARTRKFLNDDSLRRLGPIAGEEARRQLEELFERFREASLKVKP